MLSNVLILAAKHESPEAALFGTLLGIVACVLAVIAALNKNQNAVWKNGVPYCPICGKQISLKSSRTIADRADITWSNHQPHQGPRSRTRAERPRHAFRALPIRRANAKRERRTTKGAEAERQRLEEEVLRIRTEREMKYRAKGIEPGPWAW